MWLDAVKRYLRRRIVIILIFAILFTYLLMQMMRKQGSKLSVVNDDFVVRRKRPLIWRTLQEHVQQQDDNNRTKDRRRPCRNTVQGMLLIVDENGYLCERLHVLSNDCCDVEHHNTKYYTCETCNAHHCCGIYEYCVSCCLHPTKRSILEEALQKITGRQAMVYAAVEDHFELCLVKCRTNSHSVQHENRYRDPAAKYCFGPTEAHASQLEVSGIAGE